MPDCFLPRSQNFLPRSQFFPPRNQNLATPRYVTSTLYVRLFRLVTGNERRHAILWIVLRSPKTATIALSRFGPYFEQSFCLLCDSCRLFYSTSKSYLHTVALKTTGISPWPQAARAFTRSALHYRRYKKPMFFVV